MKLSRKEAKAYARHADHVGEIIAVYRTDPGWKSALVFFLVWVGASGLTFVNPDPDPMFNLLPVISYALILLGIWALLGKERLLVCENGVCVGSVAPLQFLLAAQYSSMEPASLKAYETYQTGVKDQLPYGHTLSSVMPGQMGSTVRSGWYFTGTVGFSASANTRTGERRPDGDPFGWLAGVGDADPREVARLIDECAAKVGVRGLLRGRR